MNLFKGNQKIYWKDRCGNDLFYCPICRSTQKVYTWQHGCEGRLHCPELCCDVCSECYPEGWFDSFPSESLAEPILCEIAKGISRSDDSGLIVVNNAPTHGLQIASKLVDIAGRCRD